MQRSVRWSICLAVALIGVASVFLHQPKRLWYRQNFQTGNAIIQDVEAFRKTYHRLPETLDELGTRSDQTGQVFYQKSNHQNYVVWFGTWLGESETYESATGKWQ